jgi:hypothetical protein
MPTRVIEIQRLGDLWNLYVRDTNLCRWEPYAALSYCWGGDQPIKAATKTITNLMQSIEFTALPATLRDAVVATDALGLRYLWIDALCIIQDDNDNKAIEIASMPLIYSRATITIVASRAASVGEGFLYPRKTPEPAFKVPYICPDGSRGDAVLFEKSREVTQPLDERAWALQERLLSSRILEYATRKTQWLCWERYTENSLRDG